MITGLASLRALNVDYIWVSSDPGETQYYIIALAAQRYIVCVLCRKKLYVSQRKDLTVHEFFVVAQLK